MANTKAGTYFNPTKGTDRNTGEAQRNYFKKNEQYSDFIDYKIPTHDMHSLSKKEVAELLAETKRVGHVLSDPDIKKIAGDSHLKNNKIAFYHLMIDLNADKFGFDSSGEPVEQSGDSKTNAFNEYYRDMYSLDEGTTGRRTYDTMLGMHQQQALDAQALADAQMQQAALQQAQTVKAITDQVKAERMAKLRAGMSETQIANDDMQSMMTNINALNQQATEMNTARLQAQQAYDNAQYAAYQDWINASQAQGQTAAAMSASDAGDAFLRAQQMTNLYGGDFYENLKRIQGTQTK